MRKKWIIGLIFALFTMILQVNSNALGFSGTCGMDGDNLTWELNENVLVIAGNGKMANYSPENVPPWYGKILEKIIIEDGVTSIGAYSFQDCNEDQEERINTIEFPNTLEIISDRAFFNTELPFVVLPENIAYVSGSSFYRTKVEGIHVSEVNDRFTIYDGMLYDKSYSKLIFCPSKIAGRHQIPDTVTSITHNAIWHYDEVELEIVLPDNIVNVEEDSIDGGKIYANIDSNTVVSLGRVNQSFSVIDKDYSLQYIGTSPDTNAYQYELSNVDSNCSEFTIPDNVVRIGDAGFAECENLLRIDIPSSVNWIGYAAFYRCKRLRSVNLPDNSITRISEAAFQGCSSLIEIRIPQTVTSIGDSAFCGCTALKEIVLPDTVAYIGNGAFEACEQLSHVVLPDGIERIEGGLFRGCTSLEYLHIPESVVEIGLNAFYQTGLVNITIPASVTSIGYEAFGGCSNLCSLCLLSETDISIGRQSFYNQPLIYCYEYSVAESWAIQQGYEVLLLDGQGVVYDYEVYLQNELFIQENTIQKICWSVFPETANFDCVWSSSDESVGIIDAAGVFTALSPGVTRVSLTVGTTNVFCNVTVTHELVCALDFSLPDIWIISKTATQLQIENLSPSNADINIEWLIDNPIYATIEDADTLVAGAVGSTKIHATDDISGITRSANVYSCYPVTDISFENQTTRINMGNDAFVTANVTMRTQSCVNHLVNFVSSDTDIAEVTKTGVVYAVSPGTVTITAFADSGVSATCKVVVIKDFTSVIDLPTGLVTIDSEAFSSINSIEAVRIPDSVSYIADDAFENSNVVILAPENSMAIQWAVEHNMPYITE